MKLFVILLFLFYFEIGETVNQTHPHHNCEHSHRSKREAGENIFPYHVFLAFRIVSSIGYTTCTGTIIDKRYVLTAASCTDVPPDYVIAGTMSKGEETSFSRQERDIIWIVKHPQYSRLIGTHDIAVLVLNSDLDFNENVQPIQLPDAQIALNGTVKLIHNVWKITDPFNKKLQAIEKELTECQKPSVQGDLDSGIICIKEDSLFECTSKGGEQLIQDNYLIGISLDRFTKCSILGSPQIFTKVSFFVDWIIGIVQPPEENNVSTKSTIT